MIPCACPGCRSPLTVPEALVGKTVRCPKCKNPFTVPSSSAPMAKPVAPPVARPVPKPVAPTNSPFEDDTGAFSTRPTRPAPRRNDDDEEPRPRKKKSQPKSAGPNWLLIGGVGGGGLLFVIVAVTATLFFTSGPAAPPKVAKNDPKKQPVADVKVAGVKKDAPPVDLGPMPDRIHKDNTQKVKQSTVRIKVTSPGGSVGEGSGFFALENGLVVTNAHVVGMLHRNQKPDRVEVYINSGQGDEDRRDAVVLGVDQDEDLALLKVEGGPGPAMLAIDGQSTLTELQSVYVFGFPLGAKQNTKITVSESSVSSFKHRADGSLQFIQVNGGMQPGNSGGPVVDARGNVIGVAVAIIRGTALNFAVPGDRIQGLAQGRVRTITYGEPYREGDSIRMPIKLGCSDPMSRIRSMKLDVWTGPAGNARPAGVKAPVGNDESPRKSVNLEYLAGNANGDVLVPTPAPGKALWIQPVFVQHNGNVLYGAANTVPLNTSAPLARESVNLAIDFKNNKERTLDMVGKMRFEVFAGSFKDEFTQTVTADALEVAQPTARGVDLRVSPGRVTAERKIGDQVELPPKVATDQVKSFGYTFIADETGGLFERETPNFPPGASQDIADLLVTTYEATALSIPTKKLRPMDTWNATVPLLMRRKLSRTTLDMSLICTYEGTRDRGGSKVAFIRLEGIVEPRGALVAARGNVKGYALVDIARNLIVKANVVTRTEFEFADLVGNYSIDATIERSPGNDRGINPAPKNPTPTGPLGGKLAMDKKGSLKADDPLFEGRVDNKKLPHLSFPIEMTANKNYLIDVTSDDFDTYLVLVGPDGENIIEDDDGGGNLNSRIVHRCKKAGSYKIIVTVFDKGAGNFHLRVVELGGLIPKLFQPQPNQSKNSPPPDFDRNRLGAPPISETIEMGRCAMWHDAPRRDVPRDSDVPLAI